jgi:hypothetical protein
MRTKLFLLFALLMGFAFVSRPAHAQTVSPNGGIRCPNNSAAPCSYQPGSMVQGGGGAYFFGNSPTYAGFDSTGCGTTGYAPGQVPAADCNAVGSLIIKAYGGLGQDWPLADPSFSIPKYGESAMLDCLDMQVLPNIDPGDTGAPDIFIDCGGSDPSIADPGLGPSPGTITNEPQALIAALTTVVAWGGSPHYAKILASNTTECVATSGTWTANNQFHSGVAMQTTGTGVLTCTTPYPVANDVIAVWGVYSGGTATATFAIDGTTADTWSSGAAGTIGTDPGNTATWWGQRYALPSTAATHTYTITVTSASSGDPFIVAFFVSPPQANQTYLGLVYPRVFVGGEEYGSSGGCTIGSFCATFDTDMHNLVSQLQADGFIVNYVSTQTAWPDSSIPYAGGTYPNGRVCPASTVGAPHPGDCGHLFWSWAYLNAAGKTPNSKGVNSFGPVGNVRTGAIVPQTGDYTATQVTNAASTNAPNNFLGQQSIVTADANHNGLIVKGNSSGASLPVLQTSVSGGTSNSITVSAGWVILSICQADEASSISDSLGSTWTTVDNFNVGGFFGNTTVEIGVVTASGSDTVSCNPGSQVLDVSEWAFSNVNTSSPLDGSVIFAGNSSSPQNISITTTQTDMLFTGYLPGSSGSLSGASAASPWVLLGSFAGIAAYDLGASSAATYTADWTLASPGGGITILALKGVSDTTQVVPLAQFQTPSGSVVSGVTGPGLPYITAATFSTLPSCGSTGAPEGTRGSVTDSTTNSIGATITGGGSYHIAAYCNGTNWVVASGSTPVSPIEAGFNINSGVAVTPAWIQTAPTAGSLTTGCTFTTLTSDSSTNLVMNVKIGGSSIFSSGSITIAAGTAVGTQSNFTGLTSLPLSVSAGSLEELDITTGSSSWSGSLVCR